jgi:hypothetical protein
MAISDRPQNCIDRIRCPAIDGLSRETVHILHKSLVGLVYLRRSIEDTKLCVDRSWDAVRESNKLLHRLRIDGF